MFMVIDLNNVFHWLGMCKRASNVPFMSALLTCFLLVSVNCVKSFGMSFWPLGYCIEFVILARSQNLLNKKYWKKKTHTECENTTKKWTCIASMFVACKIAVIKNAKHIFNCWNTNEKQTPNRVELLATFGCNAFRSM